MAFSENAKKITFIRVNITLSLLKSRIKKSNSYKINYDYQTICAEKR